MEINNSILEIMDGIKIRLVEFNLLRSYFSQLLAL